MIERMQIRDFQRHERLRVEFDPRVTTIVGPSDAGKSSLLRAIRWVAFNRPLGDGFVRNGSKSCSVKLWVDGLKVERRKGPDGNKYLVDGRELKAVGTEVPEEVQRLLNVLPDNFQGQHDPSYWFSLTAGEVAKRLNAIVDLEVIDRSASWLASRLRRAKVEVESSRDRLERSRGDLAALAFVPEMSKEYNRLKELSYKAEGLVGRRDGLRICLEKARQTHGAARRRVPDISGVEEGYNSLEAVRQRLRSLGRMLDMVVATKVKADRIQREADEERAKMKELMGDSCPLCGGSMR